VRVAKSPPEAPEPPATTSHSSAPSILRSFAPAT
jgi:hypothetical protein